MKFLKLTDYYTGHAEFINISDISRIEPLAYEQRSTEVSTKNYLFFKKKVHNDVYTGTHILMGSLVFMKNSAKNYTYVKEIPEEIVKKMKGELVS